jgi:hypothetical protein
VREPLPYEVVTRSPVATEVLRWVMRGRPPKVGDQDTRRCKSTRSPVRSGHHRTLRVADPPALGLEAQMHL